MTIGGYIVEPEEFDDALPVIVGRTVSVDPVGFAWIRIDAAAGYAGRAEDEELLRRVSACEPLD